MNQANLFSTVERSILLVIVLLMCFTFYKDVSNNLIESYNRQVEYEQQERLNPDSPYGNENFHFTLYTSCSGPSPWGLIYGLQFITNPVLLLLIRRQTLKAFGFSIFLNFLTFLSYFDWAYESYWSHKTNNYFPYVTNVGFGDYIFPFSTGLEQFLFVLIAVLLILQLFILARFLTQKFDGKIPFA